MHLTIFHDANYVFYIWYDFKKNILVDLFKWKLMSISQHKLSKTVTANHKGSRWNTDIVGQNMPRKSPCIPSLVDANVIYIRPLKMLLNLS